MFKLRNFRYVLLATSFVAAAMNACVAAEQENTAAIIAPFVNDDTVAAAYIDATQLKVAENVSNALQLLKTKPGDAQSAALGAMMIDGMLHRFQQAGGHGIYVVGGMADIHIGGGPIAVATTQPGQSPEKLVQLFRDLIRELGPTAFQLPNSGDWQPDVQRRGDVVLVGTKSSVARYAALKSSPRSNLLDPLSNLVNEGAVAALVFCPGKEYRRVTRELWPKLPGALAPLRAELADEWLYIEAAINAPPDARPRIAVQAKDAASAEVFAKLWRDLPIAVTQFGGNEQSRQDAKAAAQLLVNSMPVDVQGTRATIRVPSDEQQLTKLRDMFADAAEKSMQVSQRRRRADQFKQISLAMLNYMDVNRHLPAVAAISSKEGKPLLSWRVAVLPYIDEALYKEFHLDEPWDSPHNRSLIGKMPNLFADPDPRSLLAKEGKTTYQVPVGAETIFFNSEGAKYWDIADGTANTILLVDVAPSHAVEWTRPEDWQVDIHNSRGGLERDDRDFVTVAFADGHVSIINLKSTSDKQFGAKLTRAAGDSAE
jgi:prepilin-type processing-associated H-X9-DG protein